MPFLRRHQYLLLFLATLVLAGVLVLRQFRANEAAHFELREDFISLHQHPEEAQACQRVFEHLIGELPRTTDQSLVQDLQRITPLVEQKTAASQDLLWRYCASVKSELDGRSQKRLEGARARAQRP